MVSLMMRMIGIMVSLIVEIGAFLWYPNMEFRGPSRPLCCLGCQ